MQARFENIQWVVQRNLTNHEDFERLKSSCSKIGVAFLGIDIIPFTSELPQFGQSRCSIIYGSTTFNELAYNNSSLRKGVFYDENLFSIENYIEKWQRHMLNSEATISSFKELIENKNFGNDKSLFIRPNDDTKSFAGEVKRFEEIKDWYENLMIAGNTNLSPESKIVVSEPYNIQYEWRLWIVNKKVVAASKYREYFNLKKEEGCPAEVISFAENRCLEYTPHDVFVMDIGLCGDELFIIECGCMNGAGFYYANIENIVCKVTEYFQSAIAPAS